LSARIEIIGPYGSCRETEDGDTVVISEQEIRVLPPRGSGVTTSSEHVGLEDEAVSFPEGYP